MRSGTAQMMSVKEPRESVLMSAMVSEGANRDGRGAGHAWQLQSGEMGNLSLPDALHAAGRGPCCADVCDPPGVGRICLLARS